MTEISKSGKLIEWSCRILIIIDMFIILSGYLSWFQTKNQLVSPLIPESLTYQIFSDGGESYFRTSMIAGAVFLIGLLSYSFNKKTIALVIFVITALLFLGLRLL